MRRIAGRCHCGNIQYAFFWPGTDSDIPVRACNCSFCVKYHGVYTSHPEARLDVKIADRSRVHAYRFGTKTAEFHVCLNCGVVPFVTSAIDDVTYAVVNVNSFEEIDRDDLKESPSDVNGENTDSRLARRKRTWIPDVRFEYRQSL
jgi:hypothetical protein